MACYTFVWHNGLLISMAIVIQTIIMKLQYLNKLITRSYTKEVVSWLAASWEKQTILKRYPLYTNINQPMCVIQLPCLDYLLFSIPHRFYSIQNSLNISTKKINWRQQISSHLQPNTVFATWLFEYLKQGQTYIRSYIQMFQKKIGQENVIFHF